MTKVKASDVPTLREALEAIADGEGDAAVIAQQTLDANPVAATRLEALQAQPVGERDRDVGWLIELPYANGSAPSWWCGNSRGHPIWLADANRAVRFSRKDDADLVIRTTLADHDYAWRIVATDHAWMTP